MPIVFWSFRVMVGLGLLMIATGLFSLWLRYKKKLYDTPLFSRFVPLDGAVGAGRAACRLVRHRDRPPALHRLRAASDRRTPRRRSGRPASPARCSPSRSSISSSSAPASGTCSGSSRADPEAEQEEPEGPMHAAGITPVAGLMRRRPGDAAMSGMSTLPSSGAASSPLRSTPMSCSTASTSASACSRPSRRPTRKRRR